MYEASAPGRLDVMGGIADYSGSLVLQMPIVERTTVRLALRTDRVVQVHSDNESEVVSVSFDELLNESGDIDYPTSRRMLHTIPGGDWASYAIGCLLVLMKEKHAAISGANIWIESNIPVGKGVSSSAAIEVAVMCALAKACHIKLSDLELPTLAQMVENRVVGAPCGIMDQIASYLGEENKLLPILCQPAVVDPPIEIPPNIYCIGIDSGIRHAVKGASYGDVRTAAFMGYSYIAKQHGAGKSQLKQAKQENKTGDLPFRGYLANVAPSEYEMYYKSVLPKQIKGGEFIKKYGETIDTVTDIHSKRKYAVRVCARHPIYEHYRVCMFAMLMRQLRDKSISDHETKPILRLMGELMYQSHASYSACGLGNPHTDELVEAVRQAGPERGVYGAKITGGGCGGTVCVLCEGQQGLETADRIAKHYSERRAMDIFMFVGSSMGAKFTGAKQVKLTG